MRSHEGESLGGGSTMPRAWRATRVGDEVVVEVWTPGHWLRLLVLIAVLTAIPVPLIWSAIPGYAISQWVFATAYTLVSVFCIGAVLRGVGKERARLTRHELVVERFVLVTWTFTNLSTRDGLAMLARNGWLATFGSALVFGTHERAAVFGRWIGADAAEQIATLLRDVVVDADEVAQAPTGVVQSVGRFQDAHTIEGAEDLVNLEGRHPCVVAGHLRWGVTTLPWSVVATGALFALLLLRGVSDVALWATVTVVPLVLAAPIVCRGGLLDMLARRHVRRALERHPDEPWQAVPAWCTDVLARPSGERMILSGLVFLGFVAAAAWVYLDEPAGQGWGRTLVAALLGVGALFALYRMQNVYFQGRTEVRLREFPYRCPGEIEIDFAVAAPGATFRDIRFTLRRIVQVARMAQTPILGYSHAGWYELPDDQPAPLPGEQVTARFTLPDDAGGTALERPRPVFWELLVEGHTSCGWYSETFPIPIYDAPREG